MKDWDSYLERIHLCIYNISTKSSPLGYTLGKASCVFTRGEKCFGLGMPGNEARIVYTSSGIKSVAFALIIILNIQNRLVN